MTGEQQLFTAPPVVLEVPHYDNPQNDNEVLMNAQYRLLIEKDNAALVEIYTKGFIVALKFVNKISKGNPILKNMTKEERQEKAEDAITYIVEQYRTKKDWNISKNYPGYIYLRVLKSLFDRTKTEEETDYVDCSTDTTFKNLEAPDYFTIPEEPDPTEDKFIEAWVMTESGRIEHIRQYLLF